MATCWGFRLGKGRLEVEVEDPEGKIKMLGSDDPGDYDLLVNAKRFRFEGIWYDREAFHGLIKKLAEGLSKT
jgi:hypothetical protein